MTLCADLHCVLFCYLRVLCYCRIVCSGSTKTTYEHLTYQNVFLGNVSGPPSKMEEDGKEGKEMEEETTGYI